VVFSNPANDFTGNLTISAGSASLGTLKLAASNVIPNGTGTGNLTLDAGSAAGTNLATLDLAGFNETINGLISTTSLSANNVVTNTGATDSLLTLGSNNATASFSGLINDGPTHKLSITKIGTGNQTLAGNNSYTGTTTINAGQVTINGANGTIATSSGITLSGGKLFLDNSSDNNANRIANNVTLSGGELSLSGNAAGTSESFGTLGIAAGNSTVTVLANTVASTLAGSDFSRTDRGTALIRGTSLGQGSTSLGRITLTSTAGLSFVGATTLNNAASGDTTKNVRIVPYLVGGTTDTDVGSTFVTYDTTLGFRALTTSQFNNTATAGTNVRLTAAAGNITTATINSLIIAHNNVTASGINNNNVLTVSSGAVLFTDTATLGGRGTLAFGSTEAVITVNSGATALLGATSGNNNNITGSNGLTMSGAGVLRIASVKTSFTGPITVNAGTLEIVTGRFANSASSTLSVASGATVNLNIQNAFGGASATDTPLGSWTVAGTVNNIIASSQNIPVSVTLNGGTIGGTGGTAANGTLQSSDTATTITATGTSTISGNNGFGMGAGGLTLAPTNVGDTLNVTTALGATSAKTGSLTKSGEGTVTLSVASTYTGVTTITGGTLSVATIGNGSVAGSLGAASSAAANLVFNGGTLKYTGDTATSDRAFTINAGKTATIETANNLSLVGATGTATTGALTKTGVGTLTLTGDNTYTGATTVNVGTLQLGSGGANGTLSSSSAISVASGATFTVNRTGTVTQGSHFGTISGAGGFSQAGGGTTELSAVNDYTGTTTINGGTLVVSGSLSGTTALTLSGGTLQLGNGGASGSINTATAISVGPGAIFAINRNNTVTQNEGTQFSSAGITGDGGFSQLGSGTTVLDVDNGYTGPTTVSAGTLLVNSANASSAVAVNGGTLGGNGTISGTVTVGAAGSIAPGSSAVGTLSIGGGLDISALANGGTGKLNFELDAPLPATGSDKIAVTGTLTIGTEKLGLRDFSFSNLGGWAAGTYKLITSGGITGSLDPLDSSRFLFGYVATLQINVNGTDIDLVLASGSLPPSLSLPSATGIDTTSAMLGATIDSDGGAAITSQGTSWSTSPTGKDDNALAEGGTGTSAFSHLRSGMSAGTLYYAWGRAVNDTGTGYSSPTSFYTEPDQASTPVFASVQGTQVTLQWTASGSMDGAIVLVKQGSAVDAEPADGTVYNASSVFGSGDEIGTGNRVVYVGSGNSVTITGLTPLQSYYVKVYGYAAGSPSDSLINYQQDAPPAANTATPARSLVWDSSTGTTGAQDGSGNWLDPSKWWESALSANTTWNNGYSENATIGNNGTPGTITLASVTADTLTFGPFMGTYTLSGGSLTVNSTLTVGATAGTVTINTPVGGNGSLVKNGTGTLTLSGNNSYSGVTTISGGAIAISSNNALGSTAVGGHTTIAATGAATGPRLLISNNITSPEHITLTGITETAGGYAGAIQNSSGANTLSGNITLAGTGGLKISAPGGTLNLTGYITQSTTSHGLVLNPLAATAAINVSNPIAINGGQLHLVGAMSTAGATVTLNSASGIGIGQTLLSQNVILRLGVSDALNISASLDLSYGGGTTGEDRATFDLRGFNQTINALNGTQGGSNSSGNNYRIITNGVTGTSILTVGNGGGSGTFRGQINSGTGNIQLVKTGTGNQTLNDQNSYTGGTRIDDGTLTLGHATDTLANGGAVNVNGGTLALGTYSDTVGAVTLTSGSITGSGTLTGTGSAFDVRSGSVSAKLGGSVGLTKTTGDTVTLSGINSYTGLTDVQAGTLLVNGSTHSDSAVEVNGTATLGGSGIISNSVTVAATANLAPGNTAVGTLTVGSLNISALAGGTGKLFFDLGPVADSDRITVNDALAIGAGALGFSDFSFTNLEGFAYGKYTLITSGGIHSGDTLNSSDLVGEVAGKKVTLQINVNGKDLELDVTPIGGQPSVFRFR